MENQSAVSNGYVIDTTADFLVDFGATSSSQRAVLALTLPVLCLEYAVTTRRWVQKLSVSELMPRCNALV